jgi:hypothetical protein
MNKAREDILVILRNRGVIVPKTEIVRIVASPDTVKVLDDLEKAGEIFRTTPFETVYYGIVQTGLGQVEDAFQRVQKTFQTTINTLTLSQRAQVIERIEAYFRDYRQYLD